MVTNIIFNQLVCRFSAAYLHIRVWRYPLVGASSLEVLSIVLCSPSKKRGRSTWLNARADRTTWLCLTRINVSEPSSSVMYIDGIMKVIKKLLLTKSIFRSLCSNKLRNLQNPIIYILLLMVYYRVTISLQKDRFLPRNCLYLKENLFNYFIIF